MSGWDTPPTEAEINWDTPPTEAEMRGSTPKPPRELPPEERPITRLPPQERPIRDARPDPGPQTSAYDSVVSPQPGDIKIYPEGETPPQSDSVQSLRGRQGLDGRTRFPMPQFRRVDPNLRNASIVAMKSSPEDRRAAARELHPHAYTVEMMPEGHEDAGSIMVADKTGEITYYPADSEGLLAGLVPEGGGRVGHVVKELVDGIIPGDKGHAMRAAGELALGWNPITAAGIPAAREMANEQFPGGSSQSAGSVAAEGALTGGLAWAVPKAVMGGAKGVRRLANEAAAPIERGARSLAEFVPAGVAKAFRQAGGISSTEQLQRFATAKADKLAKLAAGRAGVGEAGNASVREAVEGGAAAGLSPDELPARVLGGEKGVKPHMQQELADVVDEDAEHAAVQGVREGAEKFGKDFRATGRAGAEDLGRARQEAFASGKANPEVADLVRQRREAYKGKDSARAAEINAELERMAGEGGPEGIPSLDEVNAQRAQQDAAKAGGREDTTNARGSAPPAPPAPAVPDEAVVDGMSAVAQKAKGRPPPERLGSPEMQAANTEASAVGSRAEAANNQRLGDAMYNKVVPAMRAGRKMSTKAYQEAVAAAKSMEPQAKAALAKRMLDGPDGGRVLGKLTDAQRQQIGDVLGDDAKDILAVDRVVSLMRTGKLPKAKEKVAGEGLGVKDALAMGVFANIHPAVAAAYGLARGGYRGAKNAAKAFSEKNMARVWSNPEARGKFIEYVAHGLKADPKDSKAAERILRSITALVSTEEQGKDE